jgi:DNA primase
MTQKQIMKALRNKVAADQYVEMSGYTGPMFKADERPAPPDLEAAPAPRPMPPEPRVPEYRPVQSPSGGPPLTPTTRTLSPKLERYRDMLLAMSGSSKARLLTEDDAVAAEVPVRDLVDTLKSTKAARALIFDGIITQRILDIAAEMNMHSIVGAKMGTITKQPAGLEVWTRSDFAS